MYCCDIENLIGHNSGASPGRNIARSSRQSACQIYG